MTASLRVLKIKAALEETLRGQNGAQVFVGSCLSNSNESLQASQFSGGVPQGILVELLGPACTEWLIQLLSLQPEHRVFWFEAQDGHLPQVLPTALHQRGVALERVVFASLEQDLLLALRKVVQSQLFPIVVAPNVFTDLRVFKALQLFVKKSGTTLFFMGKGRASQAWPISLQLEIHRDKSLGSSNEFHIRILRQKQGVLR